MIKIKTETISPRRAKRDLEVAKERGANIRNLSFSHLARLTRAIRDGRFLLTGDPIRYDEEGVLVDGQHRLAACVNAGVPFKTVVVRGISKDAVLTLDEGMKRTAPQVLTRLRGMKNSAIVAGIARMVFQRDKGRPLFQSHGGGSLQPNTQEIIQTLESHPLIERSATIVAHREFRHYIRAVVAGSVHFFISESWPKETADTFIHELGQGGAPNAATTALRNRLLQDVITKKGKAKSRIDELAAIITTFNRWISGEEVRKVQIGRREGRPWTDKDFPTLKTP